jgi:hypothetical protein
MEEKMAPHIPEFRPMRSFILNDVRSDNDRPKFFRWLYKQHVPESISQFMPYCTKYCTYHVLPVPPDGGDFGTYNMVMTEHYWLFNIFQSRGEAHSGGLAFGEDYPEDFMEITRQPPSKVLRQAGWQGSREGYHPLVFAFAPVFWEDDFKGSGRLTDEGVNVRWLFFFTYPSWISIDEGDAWFKEVFAREICSNDEVTRFISSRVLDEPRINPFHRVCEVWFEDSAAWHRAMVEKAGRYTPPPWATYDKFPFFEPFKDFVGAFLLDRPDSDNLQQWRGYITTR